MITTTVMANYYLFCCRNPDTQLYRPQLCCEIFGYFIAAAPRWVCFEIRYLVFGLVDVEVVYYCKF